MKHFITIIVLLLLSSPMVSAQNWNIRLDSTNVTCRTYEDGQINLYVNGSDFVSTAIYTWVWKDSDGDPILGEDDSDPIQFLVPGQYSVEVTRISDNQKKTATATIEESVASLSAARAVNQTIDCAGGSNGAIQVTASGGTEPYQYSLTSSLVATGYLDNDGLFTDLNAGTYSFSVRDANGCEFSPSDFTLADPTSIVADWDVKNAGCDEGSTTGSISMIDITGGAPFTADQSDAFNYLITLQDQSDGSEIGSGTGTYSGLAIGDYAIIITDRLNCTGTIPFSINEGFGLDSLSGEPVQCFGEQNGSIVVSVNQDSIKRDSNSKYRILIEDSSGDPVKPERANLTQDTVRFDGLGADVYTISVVDSEGCNKSISVTLKNPSRPQLDAANVTDLICNGAANGSIEFEVSGGSGTYQYSIDGGGTWSSIPIFESLSGGDYDLQVRDDRGCIRDVTDVEIFEPAKKWEVLSKTEQHISCNGSADGIAEFEYNSSPGFEATELPIADEDVIWTDATGNVLTEFTGSYSADNLDEGTYTVTITDFYGCSDSHTFTITENPKLVITASVPTISCPPTQGGGAVSINPAITGGDGTYTYLWSKNGAPTGITTSNYSGITDDATYTLRVIDGKGCDTTKSFVVNILEDIVVNVESTVDVSCMGEATGSIDISVIGGTPPYGYIWKKDGVDVGYSQNLTNLSGGTYQIEVRDDKNCGPVTQSIVIDEPSTSYTLSGEVTPVVCNGEGNGEIDITIDRGTPTHPDITNFSWTMDGNPFTSSSTDLTGLEPGTYEITTVDTYGCERSASFEVREYNELSVNAVVTENECFGDAEGEITINPFGGYLGTNAAYTVRWYKAGILQGIQNNKTSYTNLTDGIYRVEVTDSIGCKQDSVITLSAPGPISATANEQDINCRGDETGYIALDITGGTAPYIITWKENDASGSAFSTADSIFDLAPGDYFVTIEDQNDCTPFTQTYTISEPATDFNISLDPTEIQCTGESSGQLDLVLEVGAGHPDSYTVSWFKNTTPLSSQTNVAEASILPRADLGPGVYSVVATDANGCERTAEYELEDPTQIYFRPTIDSITCNNYSDGAITINPTGGYGGFSVSWASEVSSFPDTDFELGEIPGGKYTVSLTDANGCSVDTLIFMKNPPPIVVVPTITDATCVGGSDGAISITVTNGTPPYSYGWYQDDVLISTSQNLANLEAGSYELVITDQLQCEYTSSALEVSDPPSEYSISGDITKVTCRDELNGAVDITIDITGDPDLDYSVYWEKNGALFSQNTEDLNGVGFGEYEIFVEDEYGCIKSRTFSLENPEELSFIFEIVDVSCFGGEDGSVSAQVSGGYGSYTYSWKKDGVDFGITSSFANNLDAAFYQVTVTDLEGCVLTRTVEVDEPDPFQISLASTNNTCATPFDSEIDATVTGGVQPYALQWLKDGLPYSKQEDLTSVPAGTYQLMATDTNFCETSSAEVVITSPERLGLEIITQENNLCPNTQNGSLSIQGTGGSFPYTYAFDSGAYESKNNFVNLAGRKYLVSVQDDVGCTYDTVITIGNEYQLEAEFSLETEEFSIDFPISLTDESLGEGIVKWFWDFGDTRASEEQNTTVTYPTPGTYVLELTVENEVGCSLSKTDTLVIEQGYNFAVPTAFTPNGDGSNENFRPGFQNVQSMSMRVQDRNGLLVFESNELSASWDGKFNGQNAPQGSYYYEIVYTAKSGVTRTHTGKIFLLR